MGSIIVTAGPNPPQPTATPGVFLVELGMAVEGALDGYLFVATVDLSPANPVPGARTAIRDAAIAEAALHGNVFGGNDKVVSLVDPRIN